uniref:Uncharacterized protein n=1 Tax=viral metagenome TaxID=1070528 RepID=A0A6M3L5H3_9ZZZZ
MASIYEVLVTKALAADTNYAAEDVLSNSTSAGTPWTFSAVTERNGGSGYITKAVASWETTALTPRLSLFLYNATPASVDNDNTAHDGATDADVIAGKFVGRIDFPSLSDLGGNSEAIATPNIPNSGLPMSFTCASDADDLIGILVTRDAITGETATDNMTIILSIERI